MGSRRTYLALRRRAAIALAVWALAFTMLAVVAALPEGPTAALAVDDPYPAVGQVVHFNASASQGHDQGNGRIVAYRFDFGDGQGTSWQSSALAEHAYAQIDDFTASVTVVDNRQEESVASVIVHVGTSPPPPSAIPDLVPIQASPSLAAPRVNDSLNVTVVVLNRGGAAANATLVAYDLPPNAAAVWMETVTLRGPVAPSTAVSAVIGPFVLRTAGNHTLRFLITNVTPPETNSANNELDLRVSVVASTTPTTPTGTNGGGPVSPLVVGLGVAAVAAAAGASYLFLRRPPQGPLEPPPASPPDRSPPPIWPP